MGIIWCEICSGTANLNLFRVTAYWGDIMKSIIISGANSKDGELSLSGNTSSISKCAENDNTEQTRARSALRRGRRTFRLDSEAGSHR